ncbi:MAG: hypothetical protein AAB921_02635 [Patescibacteria group bacterium]
MHIVQKLKEFNAMPFPLTIPYYVSYGLTKDAFKNGEMRDGDSWMILRDQHEHYRIPETREEWLHDLTLDHKDGQDEDLKGRVASFAALLKREGITTVYSIGSGGGIFEYYLKKHAPELRVVGTECTQEGADRLRRVCTELDEVRLFDALDADSWGVFGNDPHSIVFIYRNEREFSDEQWQLIWDSMYAAHVERVFLGLMWTLTIRALVNLKMRNLKKRFRGEVLTLTGYLRSLERIRRFWKGKYDEQETIPFPTCTGIYLIRSNTSV